MIKLILNLQAGSYRLVGVDATDRKVACDVSSGRDAARVVKFLLAVVNDLVVRDWLHPEAALRIREAPDKLNFLVGRPCLSGMLCKGEAEELEIGAELLEFKFSRESREEAERSAAVNGWDGSVVAMTRKPAAK